MKKFSGDTNDRLLICDRRQCDNSDETKMVASSELSPRKRERYTKISFFPEDKVEVKGDAAYYRRVQINDDSYQIGDFAEVYPGQLTIVDSLFYSLRLSQGCIICHHSATCQYIETFTSIIK